jgi:hypothetical protein
VGLPRTFKEFAAAEPDALRRALGLLFLNFSVEVADQKVAFATESLRLFMGYAYGL